MADISGLGEFDQDTQDLFSAVGFIVVQWGQAEQSLELVSQLLFLHFDGKAMADRQELPKMLQTKLKFVRKCFSDNPQLAEFKTEAITMVDLFHEVKDARHDITHGAITSLSRVDGAFTFIRLEHNAEQYAVNHFRLEGPTFPVLAKKLLRLGTYATTLGRKLMRIAHPELPESF